MPKERSAPPGWEVNPSNALHRGPLVVVAAIGLMLSLVNFLHAQGVIEQMWEPFPMITPQGWVLRAPPFPHPELDVVGFGVLLVLSVLGSTERWRTRPLLTVVCGTCALVVATSALVRWLQQFATTGTTSTIACVVTTVAIAAAPFSLDELFVAVLREGELHHVRPTDRPYRTSTAPEPSNGVGGSRYAAGLSAVAIGVVLLVVANGLVPSATVHARIFGAIIATVGALSLPQVSRPLRWVNAGIGAWLIVAPLVFGYRVRETLHFMILGLLLMSVSIALGDDRRSEAAAEPW